VFLYGRQVEAAAASWCADLPQHRASARGTRWHYLRGARTLDGLLPDPAAPSCPGVLLDLPPARMTLLGLLLSAHGLVRSRIVATVDLRGVEAEAWVLPAVPAPRSGWQRARRGRPSGTPGSRRRPT
jgi:hypothetical protein